MTDKQPANAFPAGYGFGDFEIQVVAGYGGMGTVYRAWQLSLGRMVALKVIAEQLSNDTGFRARFQREARAAAALDHPNIVRVYEAGQINGVLYIAMQWVDGEDLRDRLATRGPMPQDLAVGVVSQIANALDAAHATGVLHRDVRPANILLRGTPSGLHAYLTDFGIARPFVQAPPADLTPVAQLVGVPGFMAPEQLVGRDVDGRADLYALGCVLFEALAGHEPFRRDTTFGILHAHASEPRPLVSATNPNIGTAFDAVVARAMAIEPDDRFPDGRSLAAAVEAAARGERTLPSLVLGGTSAPDAATGTLSGAGNDSVGDVDQLGFGTYVAAFTDLITSPDTRPPLTIGIFGSWGMGKSFLLEHIEREIETRQSEGQIPGPRVHVVRFNAWEYSATEVVWPGLVRKIVMRLDELATWPRHKRLLTRVRWNLTRQWRHLRVEIVAGTLVVGVAITAAIASDKSNIAAAIAAVVAALGAGGVLKAAKDPVAQWVTTLFADSSYGRHLGIMEDIKHDLETLEERLHGKDAAGNDVVTGRILVLIDDLDRCEPGKAVEVLQAVNLLLNFKSFVVCLGIDARIVTGAIEKHYEGLLGKSGASGYEYLDKIVQIPFRIPEPGRDDLMAFLVGQLGSPQGPSPAQPASGRVKNAPRDAAPRDGRASKVPAEASARRPEQIADIEVSLTGKTSTERQPKSPPALGDAVAFTIAERHAFELFAGHLRPNPRHLKRLVNVYRLVRALARAQREALILDRPAATIRWLVMWSQWPYASLAMLHEFDRLLQSGGGVVPSDAPAGDPMLYLLDCVEGELDPDIRARLDDEAAALRGLLSITDCGLTWDEVPTIRRYTINFNPAVEERLR